MSAAEKYANALLEQKDGAGVVLHVAFSPRAGLSEAIELVLIDALAAENIPATQDEGLDNAHRLMGQIREKEGMFSFHWSLFSQYGQGLGQGDIDMPGTKWNEEQLAKMARRVAGRIAVILKPENMQAPDVAGKQSRVFISPVSGLPQKQADKLSAAFSVMLEKSGLALTADPAQALLIISAHIKHDLHADGGAHLRIDWAFFEAGDKLIATLTQENDIPPQSLEKKWDDMVYDIADAMAPPVKNILKNLEAKKRHEE